MKENTIYDQISFAHRVSVEKLMPKVISPSIDEFFKTYSLAFPKFQHVLSIHMSSKIASIVEQAKNAQALLYDAKIDVMDCPLTEVGIKPLVIKAAQMATQEDSPRHMILNTLNACASKFHNYVVSDNPHFIKTNTLYRGGFGFSLAFAKSKSRFIFSATGGDLFYVDRFHANAVIDKLCRLIEAASKGNPIYGSILHGLDEELPQNLSEILKSRFDFTLIHMGNMSLSSMCRLGTHAVSIGFSLDPSYFGDDVPEDVNSEKKESASH